MTSRSASEPRLKFNIDNGTQTHFSNESAGNQEKSNISRHVGMRHTLKSSQQDSGVTYPADDQYLNKRTRDSSATNDADTNVSQTSTQPHLKRLKSREQPWSPLKLRGFGIGKGREAFACTLASTSRDTAFLSLLVFQKDIHDLQEKIRALREGETIDTSRLKSRSDLICKELRENAFGSEGQVMQVLLQIPWDVHKGQLKAPQLELPIKAIGIFLKKFYQMHNYHLVDWKKKTPLDPYWASLLAGETNKQATEEYRMLDDIKCDLKWIRRIKKVPVRSEYKNVARNITGMDEFIESASVKINAAIDLAKKELFCATQLMRMIWADTEEYEEVYAATNALRVRFVERVRINVHLRKDRLIQEVKEQLRVIEHGLYPQYRSDPSYHVLMWALVLKWLKESLKMDLEKTYIDEETAKRRTRLWEEDFSPVQQPVSVVSLQATTNAAQTHANAQA